MSEQYKPQPDSGPAQGIELSQYMEKHPDVIEDVELAELAAYATDEEEQKIRIYGGLALNSIINGDGADKVKERMGKRVEFRQQADEKIAAIKDLHETIKGDPSAEKQVADMDRAEKEKFGTFLNKKTHTLARETLDEKIGGGLEEAAGTSLLDSDKSSPIEFRIAEAGEAVESSDEVNKGLEIRQQLAKKIAEISGVDMPEDFDSMEFLISMQESPDTVTPEGMTQYLAMEVADTYIKQKAKRGAFGSYEEAYDYFAETSEIDLKEIYDAAESVYGKLSKTG